MSKDTSPKTPFAEVAMPWVPLVAYQGMLAVAGLDALHFFSADGTTLDRIPLALGRLDYLRTHGSLLYGWQRHGMASFLIADGMKSKAFVWNPPSEALLPKMGPGPDNSVLVIDGQRVWLVSIDGSYRTLELQLKANERCSAARAFADGMLFEITSDSIDDWHVRFLSLDGTERWRAKGYQAVPVRSGIAVVNRGIDLIDEKGNGRQVLQTIPFPRAHEEQWLSTLDDDWIAARNSRVFRVKESGATVWSTTTLCSEDLTRPEVTRDVVAAACSLYAKDKSVYFFDAKNGRLLLQAKAPTGVSGLVAISHDAIAANTYSKKIYVWTKLTSAKPERIILSHDDRVCALCSPAPGVLVTQLPTKLLFWKFS